MSARALCVVLVATVFAGALALLGIADGSAASILLALVVLAAAVLGWRLAVRRLIMTRSWLIPVVAVAAIASGCSGSGADTTQSAPVEAPASREEQRFPDIVDATMTSTDSGWRFDVTVSSPYDSPERYADAWRIVGPDGTVYGVRELTHDHASEQPFTRSLDGISIPEGVASVTIEGRDRRFGWGGTTLVIAVPR